MNVLHELLLYLGQPLHQLSLAASLQRRVARLPRYRTGNNGNNSVNTHAHTQTLSDTHTHSLSLSLSLSLPSPISRSLMKQIICFSAPSGSLFDALVSVPVVAGVPGEGVPRCRRRRRRRAVPLRRRRLLVEPLHGRLLPLALLLPLQQKVGVNTHYRRVEKSEPALII